MAKTIQRLDYSSLSEVLGQRGLIQPQRLTMAMQTSLAGLVPFTEALVHEELIGDWELSRVICDLYGMAFLPVDMCPPDPEAGQGLDKAFLLRHRLVPLTRHGRVLTIAMPGMVPADVLSALEAASGLQLMPVVGSVVSNNRWLQEHLTEAVTPALPNEGGHEGEWSSIFDVGDAAVLMDLHVEPDPDATE